MNRRPLSVIVLTLIVIMAACGDSSGTISLTSQPSPPGTTSATMTATTTPAATTAAPATTAPGGSDGEADLAARFDAALTASSEVSSGRMEGSIVISGIEGADPQDVTMSFTGAFDNANQAFAFVMDLSSAADLAGDELPPELVDAFGEFEIRQIGTSAYMRFPFITETFGVPTEWVSFPAEDTASAAGGFVPATPGIPTDILGALEASPGTSIEHAGSETIRDIATTHYVVTFDIEALLEQATPEERHDLETDLGLLPLQELPMDVWIGGDGLVHRFEFAVAGSTVEAPPGEGFGSMVVRFDLFDHGDDVDISPPPSDQVTAIDDLPPGLNT